jgi:hypothetical protein
LSVIKYLLVGAVTRQHALDSDDSGSEETDSEVDDESGTSEDDMDNDPDGTFAPAPLESPFTRLTTGAAESSLTDLHFSLGDSAGALWFLYWHAAWRRAELSVSVCLLVSLSVVLVCVSVVLLQVSPLSPLSAPRLWILTPCLLGCRGAVCVV